MSHHLQPIIDSALDRLEATAKTFGDRFPSYGEGTRYHLSENRNWLASFWVGQLWLAYDVSGKSVFCERANALMHTFEERLDDNIHINHDLGFLFTLSARAKWQLEESESARSLALRAADRLAERAMPQFGFIRAWDATGKEDNSDRFIIDTMMNLPLLFWASQETGDPRYHLIATRHAEASRDLLLRKDHSTYHTFVFDKATGRPLHGSTHQGYADESLWSRGQGWAINGFAIAAEWTGDLTFLEASRQAAERYLLETDIDEVPLWDFRLPHDAPHYPDSSAAAIAACGLLRLAKLDTAAARYHATAERIIHTLIEKAFDRRDHAQGLLRHATTQGVKGWGIDEYAVFGDYFFFEALLTLAETGITDLWGPPAQPLSTERGTMTYFTAVGDHTGLNALPTNPCKLLDFHHLVLPDGQTYTGSSDEREVLAIILGGKATFEVGDHRFEGLGERANVFAGKPYSVYIPHHTDYTITAVGDVEIALTSAPSDLDADPYVVTPDEVTTGVWGKDNFTRNYHQIITATSQPDLPASRLIVGETFTPSGNWSTYPAHKHETDKLPEEAYHEEMYFFKVEPTDGFGITRFYTEQFETNFTVRNNTILMMPYGYHTVVSAPGFTTYYLWFLAGEHRTQAVTSDAVQQREVDKLP
jgi:5-deoxy-glucuronate isomerase